MAEIIETNFDRHLNYKVSALRATGRPNVEHLIRDFYVIGVISNPVRYTKRYELFYQWLDHMYNSGVNVLIVEAQQGERSFVLTEEDNPLHVQLRTVEELWAKENMVNIGFRALPKNWKYAAWIDCDVEFLNDFWVEETIHKLQDAKIVQLFRNAVDLGPKGEVLSVHNGFIWCLKTGQKPGLGYSYFHPGFAWAIERQAYSDIGGLIDFCILGSGDRYIALAISNKLEDIKGHLKGASPSYIAKVMAWAERAFKAIKLDIDYVEGTIAHYFHGTKLNRGYTNRNKILIDSQFDPQAHLFRDEQGLYRLEEDEIILRDAIRKYFRSRNEDQNTCE